jgi:hypothetical protein
MGFSNLNGISLICHEFADSRLWHHTCHLFKGEAFQGEIFHPFRDGCGPHWQHKTKQNPEKTNSSGTFSFRTTERNPPSPPLGLLPLLVFASLTVQCSSRFLVFAFVLELERHRLFSTRRTLRGPSRLCLLGDSRRHRQREGTPDRFAPGPRRCQALLGLPDKVRAHRSRGAHAAGLCFLSPRRAHLLDTQESEPSRRRNTFHRRRASGASALRESHLRDSRCTYFAIRAGGRSFEPSSATTHSGCGRFPSVGASLV